MGMKNLKKNYLSSELELSTTKNSPYDLVSACNHVPHGNQRFMASFPKHEYMTKNMIQLGIKYDITGHQTLSLTAHYVNVFSSKTTTVEPC